MKRCSVIVSPWCSSNVAGDSLVRDTGLALNIMLGIRSPFAAHGAAGAAVPLAILSWLLVPAFIGAAVASVAAAWVRQYEASRGDSIQQTLDEARRVGQERTTP